MSLLFLQLHCWVAVKLSHNVWDVPRKIWCSFVELCFPKFYLVIATYPS